MAGSSSREAQQAGSNFQSQERGVRAAGSAPGERKQPRRHASDAFQDIRRQALTLDLRGHAQQPMD